MSPFSAMPFESRLTSAAILPQADNQNTELPRIPQMTRIQKGFIRVIREIRGSFNSEF
jgi:hypothetical protein